MSCKGSHPLCPSKGATRYVLQKKTALQRETARYVLQTETARNVVQRETTRSVLQKLLNLLQENPPPGLPLNSNRKQGCSA